MKKQNKIGVLTETAIVAIATTVISLLKPLLAKSKNQVLIDSINEETAILQDLVTSLLAKYDFLKAHFQNLIDDTIARRESSRGRGRNPHEYDLNCLYRAVILSALPIEPSLQNVQFIDNVNSKWACVDWNKPKDFSQYFAQIIAQNQNAPGAGANSISFQPNIGFWLLLVGGAYLLFNQKEFKLF
jgi:hypothetical protein